MEEKFQEEDTPDNNIEYKSLLSAYRKAYPGISARCNKKSKNKLGRTQRATCNGYVIYL